MLAGAIAGVDDRYAGYRRCATGSAFLIVADEQKIVRVLIQNPNEIFEALFL